MTEKVVQSSFAHADYSVSNTSANNSNNQANTPIKIDFNDAEKLKYLLALGLPQEDAIKLIQSHKELTTKEALSSFVQTNFKSEYLNEKNNQKSTSQIKVDFDFENYSKADLRTKAKTLANEYTKNQYIHNPQEYESLDEKGKLQAQKKVINTLIEQYKKIDADVSYEKLEELLNNPQILAKMPDNKRKAIENMIDSLMLDIQVSSNNDKTIQEFYEEDDSVDGYATSRKFEFISNLKKEKPQAYESLSKSDKAFYEYESVIQKAAGEFFNEPDIDLMEIQNRIETYNTNNGKSQNISKTSLLYDYLDKIPSGERTPTQEKLFRYYDRIKHRKGNLDNLQEFDSSNKTFRKMLKDETYQNALKKAKVSGSKDAETLAIKEYILSRLESAKNKEEYNNIIDELRSGTSFEGRHQLNKVLRSMDIHRISDDHDAIQAKGDINTDAFKDAYKHGRIKDKSGTATFVVTSLGEAGIKKKEDIKAIQRFAPYDAKLAVEAMQKGGYSEADIDNVGHDLIDNYESYEKDARVSMTRQSGYYYSEKRGIEIQQELKNKIVENNDEDCYVAFGSSASSYKGKAQRTLAEQVFSMSESFSDEANIKAQSALANDIKNCSTENQLYMHDYIMNNSKYSDVQKLAAGNIKDYDPSVQNKAYDSVYESGNKEAIYKSIDNIQYIKSPDAKKIEQNRAIMEISMSEMSEKDLRERFENCELTFAEIKNLPTSQRREYMDRYFKNMRVEDKIKLIGKIKSNVALKTIYTMLVDNNSPLFYELLKNSEICGRLLSISNMPDRVRNKIIAFVSQQNTPEFKRVAKEHHIKMNSDITGMDNPLEKEPKTANTLPNNYLSNIEGIEFLKKQDKSGTYFVS